MVRAERISRAVLRSRDPRCPEHGLRPLEALRQKPRRFSFVSREIPPQLCGEGIRGTEMDSRTLVSKASQSSAESLRCPHKVMALGLERRTQEIQM